MLHLVKRALSSFRNNAPTQEQVHIAQEILLAEEFALWSRMQNRDQRHSLEVLARFDAFYAHGTRDERAAALLHDVGKCKSTLGWFGRVIATIVGARVESFRVYLDHEAIGLTLVSGISSKRTRTVLAGAPIDDCILALRRADNM